MNIIITAKNFELTNGIKEAIEEKLSYFEKFMKNNNSNIRVVLDSRKYGKKIEVTLIINNMFIRAEEMNKDLYVAIDLVVEKLKKRLSKSFSKKNIEKNESIKYFKGEKNDDKENLRKIVKRKNFDLKPLFEDEAILQMNMLGHKVFMFFDAVTEIVCLLYKRHDESYGLIEFDKKEDIKKSYGTSDKIVKRKEFKSTPMTEEEAMLQLELLGHDVYVFLNKDTETMCLLYKRKQEGYGLIEATFK